MEKKLEKEVIVGILRSLGVDLARKAYKIYLYSCIPDYTMQEYVNAVQTALTYVDDNEFPTQNVRDLDGIAKLGNAILDLQLGKDKEE